MHTHNAYFSRPIIYTLSFLFLSLAFQGCNDKQIREPPQARQCQLPEELTRQMADIPPVPTSSNQHALVVGINQYQNVSNLKGAVNDAILLTQALRRAKVQLPDERILLDTQATREAFLKAWYDMLDKAQPGDTLILTFSGHGIQQETDTPPLDELDQKDEGLIFHEFDFKRAIGYIIDDELYGLFEKASEYQIVFLVDACHSSGMKRSTAQVSEQSVRFAGSFPIIPTLPSSLPTTHQEENLPHVTLITAVERDTLKVIETSFNGKLHGALSWYFAEALDGKANGNQNHYLERQELDAYLRENVRRHTAQRQIPKLLPAADRQSVIKLPSRIAPTSSHPNIPEIAVYINDEKTIVDKGLKQVRFVSSAQSADLRFIIKDQHTEVFNRTGDKVTSLSSSALKQWQRVIDKERLLNVLATQFDMRRKPIWICLEEGDGLHQAGTKLHFNIEPGNANLNALTLFNLAGDGQLQFLYPQHNHPQRVQKFPYRLEMEVAAPYGSDHLVAVLCEKPAIALQRLLDENWPNDPEKILAQLRDKSCQVGQYAFFSSE